MGDVDTDVIIILLRSAKKLVDPVIQNACTIHDCISQCSQRQISMKDNNIKFCFVQRVASYIL